MHTPLRFGLLVGTGLALGALAAEASIVPPKPAPATCSAAPAPGATRVDRPKMAASQRVRGYFYAGGRSEGLGGFAGSGNAPGSIPSYLVCTDRLAVVAEPDHEVVYGEHRGLTVYVINGTTSEVGIEAQDSRLPIVREAKDESGAWREVEYLPQSWCGNSYHTVFLPSKQAWRFAAPKYAGDFQTELRFRLDAPDGPVYSNVFKGTIDPLQFGEKQGHTPSNLMDPYDE